MDPSGDVFIDTLSLQEILPRDMYHFSDHFAPFSCSHTLHSGCYFRLIFSQLSLDPADRHPWNEIRCPICRSSLRETILTRFLHRDRNGLGRFPARFSPSRLATGSLLPPLSSATFDFGNYNLLLPHHVDTTPSEIRISRRRARSENSVCSICNNLHYTNHLSALIDHLRPSAHTSPRLVVEHSGIEDIIPYPPNARLFAATYPFSCASHYQIFARNLEQDHRAHWTHFGCLANVLVYSAIYSPTSPVDGQDDFFSPTARRFEQFSCPDCNAPLRPEIIAHGACRSFSAGRVFPFGNRYPIDPLSPQENDLVDGYPLFARSATGLTSQMVPSGQEPTPF